uniref:Uncharacterized protein n=1 Tax=Onchocerca volvulus TaxID=6282 RepID=A0A8R1XZI4_ONCVO
MLAFCKIVHNHQYHSIKSYRFGFLLPLEDVLVLNADRICGLVWLSQKELMKVLRFAINTVINDYLETIGWMMGFTSYVISRSSRSLHAQACECNENQSESSEFDLQIYFRNPKQLLEQYVKNLRAVLDFQSSHRQNLQKAKQEQREMKKVLRFAINTPIGDCLEADRFELIEDNRSLNRIALSFLVVYIKPSPIA